MVILFFSNNYKLHYNVIDAEKLLDTHSGDEGVTVDIAAEQRMLEEEDVDETSDASTLNPEKGKAWMWTTDTCPLPSSQLPDLPWPAV